MRAFFHIALCGMFCFLGRIANAQTHQGTATLFQNTTANSITQNFSGSSPAGRLFIVQFGWDGQSRSIAAVGDNKGNVYTKIHGPTNWNGTGDRTELWYTYNTLGGGTPVSISGVLSGAPTSYMQMYMSQYSGIETTVNPLDQHKAGIGNVAAATSGTVATLYTNELIWGVAIGASGALATGAGFTNRSTANQNIVEDKNVATAGTYNTSFTSAGGNWIAEIATFRSTTSVLPIVLRSFDGYCSGNSVTFEWSTASEKNNAFFTIEKSKDGLHYETMSFIPGNGTSVLPHEYEWTCINEDDGEVYYRLSQTDFDGAVEHHNIVVLNCGLPAQGAILYPAITFDRLNLKLNSRGGTYEATVTDCNGSIMVINKGTLEPGLNTIGFPVQFLEEGVYLIKLITNSGVEYLKFVRSPG
jgi:hypothetical protein